MSLSLSMSMSTLIIQLAYKNLRGDKLTASATVQTDFKWICTPPASCQSFSLSLPLHPPIWVSVRHALPAWLGFLFSVRKPRHAAPLRSALGVSNHFGWLCFHWCRNSLHPHISALQEICEQLVWQTAKYYQAHTQTYTLTHISGCVKCLSLKWTKSMCRMWNHFKSARLLLPLTKCARFFLTLTVPIPSLSPPCHTHFLLHTFQRQHLQLPLPPHAWRSQLFLASHCCHHRRPSTNHCLFSDVRKWGISQKDLALLEARDKSGNTLNPSAVGTIENGQGRVYLLCAIVCNRHREAFHVCLF